MYKELNNRFINKKDNIMKRFYSTLLVLIFMGVNLTYAGLWPSVDKPDSPDASMIVLQFSIDDKGNLTSYANTNASMWAPVVKKEDGTLVKFKVYSGGADMTNIYYKENLVAGKYTLVGFHFVYTDFGELDKYRAETGDKTGPYKHFYDYDEKPYHIRQVFPLEKPIEFNLEPNKIMTLGHYVIKKRVKEGIMGTSDDRYRVTRAEIMMADSEDQSLLSYIKPWSSKKWKLWNAKNPAKLEE